jgi:hypothetical protein
MENCFNQPRTLTVTQLVRNFSNSTINHTQWVRVVGMLHAFSGNNQCRSAGTENSAELLELRNSDKNDSEDCEDTGIDNNFVTVDTSLLDPDDYANAVRELPVAALVLGEAHCTFKNTKNVGAVVIKATVINADSRIDVRSWTRILNHVTRSFSLDKV